MGKVVAVFWEIASGIRIVGWSPAEPMVMGRNARKVPPHRPQVFPTVRNAVALRDFIEFNFVNYIL